MSVALIAATTAIISDAVDGLTVIHLREKFQGVRREQRLVLANEVIAQADAEADTRYVYQAATPSPATQIVNRVERRMRRIRTTRKRFMAALQDYRDFKMPEG